MFLKKNVIDFLYDVIKDEELEIYPFVKYVSMHPNIPCQNKISRVKDDKNVRVCQLSLNRKYFSSNDRDFLKALLLHEIGHSLFKFKSKTDNEYFAHLWAINKASTMKIPKVVNKLILLILEWEDMSWNDYKCRRYILASKKFQKLFNSI